jgi:hypothetical protein
VGRVGIPLTGLTLPHFCVGLKPGSHMPCYFLYSVSCGEWRLLVLLILMELLTITVSTFFSYFVFSELRWQVIVCFIDIDGIVDHHCLNFLILPLCTHYKILTENQLLPYSLKIWCGGFNRERLCHKYQSSTMQDRTRMCMAIGKCIVALYKMLETFSYWFCIVPMDQNTLMK